MSKIPKVGLHLIITLALTLVACAGLRFLGHRLTGRQPLLTPPDSVGFWQRTSGGIAPLSDGERDYPLASYSTYTYRDFPPVFVSYARATTLNSFRDPSRYLVDKDGRVPWNSRIVITPHGKPSAFVLEPAYGHSVNVFLAHWAQVPGHSPRVNAMDLPDIALKSLVTHRPFYICDAWIPIRSGASGAQARDTLLRFADRLSKDIAASPKP